MTAGGSSLSSSRAFFRSLSLKQNDGQASLEPPNTGSSSLKVNFTLESLLDFQRTHHAHSELAGSGENVLGDGILGHHKRPNYNNQQRRLLAKGRQHSQQQASNSLQEILLHFASLCITLHKVLISFCAASCAASAVQGKTPMVVTLLVWIT